MTPRTAERVRGVPPSATLRLSEQIAAAAAQGRKLLNLAGGDPDVDTPAHVVEAAVGSLRAGRTHYAPGRGTPELRRAVATAALPVGLRRDPATEILVAGSAKLALAMALDAVVDPGDEVLLLGPAWVSYAPLVRLRGGVPVQVPTVPDDGYRVTSEALAAAAGPKTTAIVVNTPCNPTGHVLGPDELGAVTQMARDRNWTIISDEVYSRLVFEGEHRSPAVEAPERTIVVDGLSKGFAMTGWRIGWLHGPSDLVGAAALVYEHTVSCAPTFIQDAAVAALTAVESADAVAGMVRRYRRRRDVVLDQLSACTGLRVPSPEGAFYLFPDVSGTGLDGTEFADGLLVAEDVAVLPGVAFGDRYADHVRLSLALPDDRLIDGVRRLRTYADSLTGSVN